MSRKTGGPAPDDDAEAFELLRRTRDPAIREALVERHAWMIEPVVHRLARAGVDIDELREVARAALGDAVDRYELSPRVSFASFARQAIQAACKGDVREHWQESPPRRADDPAEMRPEIEYLKQILGRSPTPAFLARHLGWSEERVLEAMEAEAQRRNGHTIGGGEAP
jgi:RNA polymerase sigma-B factor